MFETLPLPITECDKNEKVWWDEITIAGIKCFMKRNIEPSEFVVNKFNHRIHVQPNGANRIRNEKLALEYVRNNTSIPVPEVIFYLDEGSRVYLATRFIEGIPLADIEDRKDKQKVFEQVDSYVKELEEHRWSRIRSFGLDVCLPPCATYLDAPSAWARFKQMPDERFVLCHGDLHDYNILVDPKTLKVTAIIDWEFAGYYPPNVDPRRYKYGRDIIHLSDGTFMPAEHHETMARKLVYRYTLWHEDDLEAEQTYIEIVDGIPVRRVRNVEPPDDNGTKANSESKDTAAALTQDLVNLTLDATSSGSTPKFANASDDKDQSPPGAAASEP